VDQTWLFALLSLGLILKPFSLRFSRCAVAPLREKILCDSVMPTGLKHFSRGGRNGAAENSF
jgi:hypothetical protein